MPDSKDIRCKYFTNTQQRFLDCRGVSLGGAWGKKGIKPRTEAKLFLWLGRKEDMTDQVKVWLVYVNHNCMSKSVAVVISITAYCQGFLPNEPTRGWRRRESELTWDSGQ